MVVYHLPPSRARFGVDCRGGLAGVVSVCGVFIMLAAELKKFSQEVRLGGRAWLTLSSIRHTGSRQRPAPCALAGRRSLTSPAHLPSAQAPRPTPAAGGCSDAMGGLHLGPGASGGGICSQSLPSHSHMSMRTLVPRIRPSPAPSFAGMPLMVRPRCQESAIWPLASFLRPLRGRPDARTARPALRSGQPPRPEPLMKVLIWSSLRPHVANGRPESTASTTPIHQRP